MHRRIIVCFILATAILSACGQQATRSGSNDSTATGLVPTEGSASTNTPTEMTRPTLTAQPTQANDQTATTGPTLTSTPVATAAPDSTATASQDSPVASIRLEPVAKGFTRPLYLTTISGDSQRLFVVEQAGVVKIIRDGAIAEQPFLDISKRVGSEGNEQGLLSLAFHPKYGENGYFFVDYTNTSGDTVISRFQASGDTADPESEQILLTIDQPYANHNGGLVTFGPDGYLYIGMGDGGSAGDPENRAQNLDELLGKILRIDVDGATPYAIPPDNPYAQGGGKPEIWAYGLRNPWRFSFDRTTGDLFIGDVGQNKYEEIDFQLAGQSNVNYGWRLIEGKHCYQDDCDLEAYQAPIAEYPHEQGCSVTGGYIYHGAAFPQLQGIYYYADYCQGTIWALQRDGDSWNTTIALKSDLRISSFGEDQQGELYIIDGAGGGIYRLVASNA